MMWPPMYQQQELKEKPEEQPSGFNSRNKEIVQIGGSGILEKELRKIGSVLKPQTKGQGVVQEGGLQYVRSGSSIKITRPGDDGPLTEFTRKPSAWDKKSERSARDGANTGGGPSSSTGFSARPGEMRSAPGLGNRNLDRAEELQRQGMTKSAQRQREAFERLQDKQRLRDANRQLQKDLGMQSGARMRPEDIARHEGKVNPLDRDAFNKRVKEIEQEIKDRAGQGDGTQNTSIAPGGGGGKSGESSLEKLVGEIKALVEKIEPKLPTHALA
jgi:hypothetical protein